MPQSATVIDRVGTLLQAGAVAQAAAVVREGLSAEPGSATLWNLQGGVCLAQGQVEGALAAFVRAAGFDPADPEPLANLAQVQAALGRWPEVAATCLRWLDRAPGEPRARALIGRSVADALERLEAGAARGWPDGPSEGAALQAAFEALRAALDAGFAPEVLPQVAAPIFMRVLAWDQLDRLGGFEALGRRWAAAGQSANLLMQLPRAGATRSDRVELLDQHRLWGRAVEAATVARPAAPAGPPRAGRIRLGFKSSDLRRHAVGTFAWPLFAHPDPRFELYVYSFFPGPADPVQAQIASRVQAYRHIPQAADGAAADLILADRLDVLVEIGGPTAWNRIELMAHRLAPVQVSWLGYPHSVGLSTIDHMIVDPWTLPPDPALLLEAPLVMPRSWIALDEAFFRDEPAPAAAPPQAANGFVTFGTASAPYKYSPACIDAWARVLEATPRSRFLVVRPEAGAPAFRENLLAGFARWGIAPERIGFEPVRGAHLPHYDRIDISLDTLPLTGGTTTCESLWMGVPVVSLAGDALYERLSWSILNNAGLADLCAFDVEGYVAVARALAQDPDRLAALRAGLRSRLRASALGDAAAFARDFYDLIAGAVAAAG